VWATNGVKVHAKQVDDTCTFNQHIVLTHANVWLTTHRCYQSERERVTQLTHCYWSGPKSECGCFLIITSEIYITQQQQQPPFYCHFTGQPALAGTSSSELEDFVGATLYCPHALHVAGIADIKFIVNYAHGHLFLLCFLF